MSARERADRLLVARGLFATRSQAQQAIAAGCVRADGIVLRKAAETVAIDAAIDAAPAHPWVSRGGLKLAAALDHFGIDVAGRRALDVGASTGGFTEVLLARGARHVHAVDVGHDQLHPRLRDHAAITSHEGTDIRRLDAASLTGAPEIIVADVSFTSLKTVLPAAFALAAPQAALIALIKPQFEAGRRHLKKGIVRDDSVQQAVCDDIAAFIAAQGWRVLGVIPSPIAGGDGNREFLIGAQRG